MRTSCTLLFLFTAALAHADSTLTDPFHQSQTNCSYSMSYPYSSCDVIGDEAKYDIQSLSASFTGNTTEIRILLNYANNNLTPFVDDGLTLSVGDLLFFNPTNWSGSPANQPQYLYGVPLAARGSFVAGDVYQVANGITTVTADQVINNTGYYYRRNQMVWLSDTGTPSPSATGGSVVVSNFGDGVNSAKYQVDLTFADPAGFFPQLLSPTGQIGVSFAAADCGNDIVMGTVSAVPEPGSIALFGTVCLLLVPVLRKVASRER